MQTQDHQSRSRNVSIQKLIFSGLAAFALFSLTHCGSSNSTTTPGTFTDVYSTMTSSNCAQCHTVNGSAYSYTTLDLSSQASAYTTLKSLTSTGPQNTGCSGVALVNASAGPASSMLEAMVDSSYDTSNFAIPGCTPDATHLSNLNYSAAERSSLTAWIQAGAPNN